MRQESARHYEGPLGGQRFFNPKNYRISALGQVGPPDTLVRRHDDRRLWIDQAPKMAGESPSRCTAAALLHYGAAGPVKNTTVTATMLDHTYQAIQAIDREEGRYYGSDGGATSLAMAKHALRSGMIGEYRFGYTMDEYLVAAAADAVSIGMEWHTGYDRPDAEGIAHMGTTRSRGGHEILQTALDMPRGLARFKQSWGKMNYGLYGHVWIPLEDIERGITVENWDVMIFRELPVSP